MPLNVVIYGRPDNGALGYIEQGFKALGHSTTRREDRRAYTRNSYEKQFDIAVTDGIRSPMTIMRDEYKKAGKTVLVSDLPFFRTDFSHHQLGLFELNWMPDFDCPPDRFNALGLEIEPRQTGDYIVIAGQKAYDAQHYMSHAALTRLYQGWIDEIRKVSDRPIVFRPHPKSHDMRLQGVEHDIPTNGQNGGLKELLQNAHCLVAYNSTACTEATMWGVPVFCDESAQIAPIANVGFENLENPFFPDDSQRLGHFSRVAYAQWDCHETMSGEAISWYLENVIQ